MLYGYEQIRILYSNVGMKTLDQAISAPSGEHGELTMNHHRTLILAVLFLIPPDVFIASSSAHYNTNYAYMCRIHKESSQESHRQDYLSVFSIRKNTTTRTSTTNTIKSRNPYENKSIKKKPTITTVIHIRVKSSSMTNYSSTSTSQHMRKLQCIKIKNAVLLT